MIQDYTKYAGGSAIDPPSGLPPGSRTSWRCRNLVTGAQAHFHTAVPTMLLIWKSTDLPLLHRPERHASTMWLTISPLAPGLPAGSNSRSRSPRFITDEIRASRPRA